MQVGFENSSYKWTQKSISRYDILIYYVATTISIPCVMLIYFECTESGFRRIVCETKVYEIV